MRSTTAAQDAALAANVRGEFVQIEVQNADGTWIDLTNLAGFDWVMRWSVSWGVDQPLPEARVSLVRDRSDANRSLAPLRSDSPLNVDDLAAYAPLLDGGRGFRINVAVMAWGSTPGPSDWVRLFTGEIDEVEWGQDPVEIIARSAIGVQLADRFIETETVYGSEAGTAMETVMQSILTDWTDDPVSLYTPTPPGFNVTSTPFQGISVLEALNRITALIGWAVRERWHDVTAQFRLTLQDPDRAKMIPDHTFGPGDYWDVEGLRIGRNEVRNAIRVTYVDSATGEEASVTAEDATSIARYGRKPLLITESSSGPIDTAAEAQAMADAALADLKDPVAEQRVDNRFFWPVQLGDLYTWTANGVHYNVDQDLAVTRIEHHGEAGTCGTRLDVRGAPMGFNRYWRTRGSDEATPRLAASFEPRIVPAVVGGVAGAHIDVSYDLAPDVTRVYFQFKYTDGTTTTKSYNETLSGVGVHRLEDKVATAAQLFLPGWTDIEILCRVNNNSFDPSEVGRKYIFSYPDIFAGGEGVRAALSAGGTAQADYFVAGTGVTIDTDANGRPRVSATGGGGASALNDLSDVVIASLVDDDALMYDSGTVDWRNRALTAGDIKTGTLGVARGGSGAGTWEAGAILLGNGASAFGTISPSAAGILKSDGISWSSSVLVAGDIPGLDTSKIITGTFASARLAGAYTGITGLGTLTSLTVSGAVLLTASKFGETSHNVVVFDAASDFAQPSGYRTMVHSGAGGSTLLPSGYTGYGFYQVMGRRDAPATPGYHGLFFSMGAGRMWVAENADGSLAPSYHEVLTEDTPSFTAQALTAQSLALNTDLAVAYGGTGASSWEAGAILLGNGGSAFGTITPTGAGILKSDGISWSASTLVAGDIPGLDTSKIITGTFTDARIPGTLTFDSGSAAAPSVSGASFGTSGLYWATGVVGISVSGTSRIRATTTGGAVTGTLTATGDVQSSVSDARLKTELRPIEGALDRVGRLHGVTHRYTDEALDRWPELTASRRAALIAQDVAGVLPEAVVPFAGDDAYLNYMPDMVIPLLVEAIKELRGEVESLRARRAA